MRSHSTSVRGMAPRWGGEPKVAVYLGKDIFINLDAFESSLFLLAIPEELEAKEATLSAPPVQSPLCTRTGFQ